MVVVSLRGISVHFPFTPYPCQLDYMEKVLECLQTGTNGLLESPTGTGKTLCLLCATLAWQEYEKNQKSMKLSIGYNLPPQPGLTKALSSSSGATATPTITKIIIYASRTHSQLTQVINELRSTNYIPKMTIMASRDQLCINDRLRGSVSGAALNHSCNKMSSQRSCLYKNNLDTYTGSGECGSMIMDIENLVNLGRQDSICPYFYSRENATRSELILLPYNYLIDSSVRSTLRGVCWQDACVIIDEAHNLEQIASDASSFSLTTNELTTCITELQSVIRLLQLHQSTISSSESEGKSNGKSQMDALARGGPGEKPNMQQCALILRSLFNLEDRINKLVIIGSKSGPVSLTDGSKCLVLPGSWFVTTLAEVGLPFENSLQIVNELKLASDYLMDDLSGILGGTRTGAIQEPRLSYLAQCFSKIYKGRDMTDCVKQSVDYSVFIRDEASKLGKGKRTINYWCFSPGVAMEELKRLGVRSILLTSGTLSPMEAFREDLKIPFPVTLENPHVIGQNQVWISAIGTGPNSKVLNSSYERRDTTEYKDELGVSILNICRSMRGLSMTQHNKQTNVNLTGGILVFFPAYGTMDSAVARWRSTGLWGDLCQAAGHIVMENRGSEKVKSKTGKDKQETMEKTNFVMSTENQMGTIEEFESAIQRRGTCMLLAVCRGKVSEGIDFRDSKGRIVVITGIPYAPHLDPWIVLKKQHLDDAMQPKGTFEPPQLTPQAQAMRLLSGTSSGTFSTPSTTRAKLSGQGWYVQSASRAVNQAMGRVIRHQKDWGAIFLLDGRFANDKQCSQLSRWLRPRLKKQGFFPAMQSFREFCAAALSNPELQLSLPQEPRAIIRDTRVVPSHIREGIQEDTTTKEVVIPAIKLESDVAGTDGYIDPTLLLSQSTFIKRQNSGFQINTSSKTLSSPETKITGENDVSTILSQVKSVQPSTSKLATVVPKRSIADLFSKSSTEITPSTKSCVKTLNPAQTLLTKSESTLSAKLREKSSISVPISSSATSRSESKRFVGLHATDSYSASQEESVASSRSVSQPSSQSGGIRAFFSQDLSQSLSQTLSVRPESASSQSSRKSQKEVFKQLVAHLQTQLSDTAFQQLMVEIKKIAALSREHGGIQEVGQIRQFVSDMMRVLAPELSPSQLKHSMEIFGTLFPENHLELYTTIVEKSIQFHSAAASAKRLTASSMPTPLPPPPPPPSAISKRENPHSIKMPHAIAAALSTDLAQESRASKRAKMMQTSASKSLLSSVDGISLPRTSPLGSSIDDSSHLKRFECPICYESPPRQARVAPCGHICCLQCWETWLSGKSMEGGVCPKCRKLTKLGDLARIRVAT